MHANSEDSAWRCSMMRYHVLAHKVVGALAYKMASIRRFDKEVILITDPLSFIKPFESFRRRIKGDFKLSLHFIHKDYIFTC